MNIKALRQVQRDMKARPDQVIMGTYFDSQLDVISPVGGCGTAGCIAGFATFRSLKSRTLEEAAFHCVAHPHKQAKSYLRLTEQESLKLFYHLGWPDKFIVKLRAATTPKAFTAVVIARIDHFITSKGRE